LFGAEEIKDRKELIKSLELSEQTKDVVELINKLKNINTDRIEKYRADKKQRLIDIEKEEKESIDLIKKKKFLDELEKVESVNNDKLKKFINDNKKGFDFLMKKLIESGESKDQAFVSVMVDYYNDSRYMFSIEEYAKLMIEFGYNFESRDVVNKMIYPR
jgi:seryl-tRNA synthetase